MKFRTSLRYRVTFAFTLLGAFISATLATVLYRETLSAERRLVAETLTMEVHDYLERHAHDPAARPPASAVLRLYMLDTKPAADVPAELLTLPPGLHRLQLQGNDHYVEIVERGDQRIAVVYSDQRIRRREQQYRALMVSSVVFMTLLSAALGYWLAGRVVSPVAELARRVGQLVPGDTQIKLARRFSTDEVGVLAQSFDAYQERLQAFIQREQAFTADVSHELRTPLAVVEGAAEVLQEDPRLQDDQRARVRRITRATQEMAETTAALLELAREQVTGQRPAGCRVAGVLRELVDMHRSILDRKRVEVLVDIQTDFELPTDCALLRIVVGNLIHNAFSYTVEGRVSITLDAGGIRVSDTGVGISDDQLDDIFRPFHSEQGGEGIGLSLVKRICLRYGWRLDVTSELGAGTCFRLLFDT